MVEHDESSGNSTGGGAPSTKGKDFSFLLKNKHKKKKNGGGSLTVGVKKRVKNNV